jgi:tetratricopeptide (TPR) repeat protein
MVHSYANRETTPDAIKHDLDVTPEEFDKQYLAWIDKKYASRVSHFDEWREALKSIAAAAREKRWDTVVKEATAGLPLYPEYVGDGSMYEFLAAAYREQNDSKDEARVLSAYEHAGGQDPEVLKHLADLEEHDGNERGAAETLSRVNYIYPVNDAELHRHLGDLLYDQKTYDQATREYAAAVASHPVDKAGAQFLLAKAYLAAGHKSEAEESVLAALEIAPGYAPAQRLLLELHQSPEK